ncbi:MAG: SDR family oxidoreductase [Thermodesulfobacteriota bacterium]
MIPPDLFAGRCPIRCLITGGAGFIGSHLVQRALQRGHEVVVLDNLSTGNLANLAGFRQDIEFFQGDIQDLDLVSKCSAGCEVVFHHAAVASVPVTVQDPILSARVNDLGTLNVFLAARDRGAAKVVYASSSAVYGGRSAPPHPETARPAPASPYAAHKLLGEYYAGMFWELYGLDVVSLRYFNVFGPRQDPSSPYSGVISIFFDRIRQGLSPVIYGDGRQTRDFIYVEDVVEANFLAAQTPRKDEQVYNIGTGREVTLLAMLDVLRRLSGKTIEPIFDQPRAGDVQFSRAEIAKAAVDLGFTARTPFEDGLARTWAWFCSAPLTAALTLA